MNLRGNSQEVCWLKKGKNLSYSFPSHSLRVSHKHFFSVCVCVWMVRSSGSVYLGFCTVSHWGLVISIEWLAGQSTKGSSCLCLPATPGRIWLLMSYHTVSSTWVGVCVSWEGLVLQRPGEGIASPGTGDAVLNCHGGAGDQSLVFRNSSIAHPCLATSPTSHWIS